MEDYSLAWTVILLAALGGAVSTWLLLRPLSSLAVKVSVIAALLGFFLAPTQVPQAPEVLAPAFVVVVFEAFFQIDGTPLPALMSLVTSVVAALVISLVVVFFYQRKSSDT